MSLMSSMALRALAPSIGRFRALEDELDGGVNDEGRESSENLYGESESDEEDGMRDTVACTCLGVSKDIPLVRLVMPSESDPEGSADPEAYGEPRTDGEAETADDPVRSGPNGPKKSGEV